MATPLATTEKVTLPPAVTLVEPGWLVIAGAAGVVGIVGVGGTEGSPLPPPQEARATEIVRAHTALILVVFSIVLSPRAVNPGPNEFSRAALARKRRLYRKDDEILPRVTVGSTKNLVDGAWLASEHEPQDVGLTMSAAVCNQQTFR
jgi:hypothetical protein